MTPKECGHDGWCACVKHRKFQNPSAISRCSFCNLPSDPLSNRGQHSICLWASTADARAERRRTYYASEHGEQPTNA